MQGAAYLRQIRDHLRSAYLLSDEKINTVLPGFLQTLRSHMNILEEALHSGSDEALNRAGHSLKGALLNLGLTDLAEPALDLEQYCRNQGNETDCALLVAKLKEEISKMT